VFSYKVTGTFCKSAHSKLGILLVNHIYICNILINSSKSGKNYEELQQFPLLHSVSTKGIPIVQNKVAEVIAHKNRLHP
jgi:hypothetical protein